MTLFLRFVLLCAFFTGCAAQQRTIIYQSAKIAKELADVGATTWRDAVALKTEECRRRVPVGNSTEEERAQCLGVFNETEKALRIFENIVTAQHAVYWALKFGTIEDATAALQALDDLLLEAKPLLEAARKQVR